MNVEHAARIPARAPDDLRAHAVRLTLIVPAELHQVTAGEDLGARLRGACPAGIAEDRSEQAEEAIGDDALEICCAACRRATCAISCASTPATCASVRAAWRTPRLTHTGPPGSANAFRSR